jgi:hypothetical protein
MIGRNSWHTIVIYLSLGDGTSAVQSSPVQVKELKALTKFQQVKSFKSSKFIALSSSPEILRSLRPH